MNNAGLWPYAGLEAPFPAILRSAFCILPSFEGGFGVPTAWLSTRFVVALYTICTPCVHHPYTIRTPSEHHDSWLWSGLGVAL